MHGAGDHSDSGSEVEGDAQGRVPCFQEPCSVDVLRRLMALQALLSWVASGGQATQLLCDHFGRDYLRTHTVDGLYDFLRGVESPEGVEKYLKDSFSSLLKIIEQYPVPADYFDYSLCANRIIDILRKKKGVPSGTDDFSYVYGSSNIKGYADIADVRAWLSSRSPGSPGTPGSGRRSSGSGGVRRISPLASPLLSRSLRYGSALPDPISKVGDVSLVFSVPFADGNAFAPVRGAPGVVTTVWVEDLRPQHCCSFLCSWLFGSPQASVSDVHRPFIPGLHK